MKKKKVLAVVIATTLVLTLCLASTVLAAKPVSVLLDSVDIGSTTDPPAGDEVAHGVSFPDWGPVEPDTNGGNWGGFGASIGDCRVVWHAADDTSGRSATLTLDTTALGEDSTAKARHIKMSVLDGIADDSFNVYVMNPGGNWALVYSYACDPSTSEYWVEHDIYSFPAGKGKGQGTTINIKIESTGAAWSGFGTYGQMAVDWVEVWGH